jgi:hypothetical protein
MKHLKVIHQSYNEGWSDGWDACESFFEQSILNGDPGFQEWLDKLELQAKKQRDAQDLEMAERENEARKAAGLPPF